MDNNKLLERITFYMGLRMEISFKNTGYNSNEISMIHPKTKSTRTVTLPDNHMESATIVDALDFIYGKLK